MGRPQRNRLTLSNLHGRKTYKIKAYIKEVCNSLVRFYLRGCTEALKPIYAGLRALMKVEDGKHLDLRLENEGHLER